VPCRSSSLLQPRELIASLSGQRQMQRRPLPPHPDWPLFAVLRRPLNQCLRIAGSKDNQSQRLSRRFVMRSARVTRSSQHAGAADALDASPEFQVEERDHSADASCDAQHGASDVSKELSELQSTDAKPLRRRGPRYSWTLWDHCALLASSALLMVRAGIRVCALIAVFFLLQRTTNLTVLPGHADVNLLLLLRRPLRLW
jgi:hypothetical protein